MLVEEPKALVVKDVDEELNEVLDALVAPGVCNQPHEATSDSLKRDVHESELPSDKGNAAATGLKEAVSPEHSSL